MVVRAFANALLPVLLVLYPLLLLLDDVEPGFVRSVVNPHVFLIALLVAGVLASRDREEVPHPRNVVAAAIVAAVIGGAWVAWRLHAGALGIVVGLLAAIAIGAVAWIIAEPT